MSHVISWHYRKISRISHDAATLHQVISVFESCRRTLDSWNVFAKPCSWSVIWPPHWSMLPPAFQNGDQSTIQPTINIWYLFIWVASLTISKTWNLTLFVDPFVSQGSRSGLITTEVTLKKARAQGLRYLAEDVCAVGLQASLASLDAAVAAGSVPSKLLNEQPGQVRGVEGVILVMLMVWWVYIYILITCCTCNYVV